MYNHNGIKYLSHQCLSESNQEQKQSLLLQKHTVNLKEGLFWHLRGDPEWECGKLFYKLYDNTHELKFDRFNYVRQGGTHDPRYFYFNGDLYLLFNGLLHSNERGMFLYNFSKNILTKLWVLNTSHLSKFPQKNWMPYIYSGELFFVFSFQPNCVLKLSSLNTGECEIVKGNPLDFEYWIDYAGSTCFSQISETKFFGFARSRAREPGFDKIMKPVPVIWDAEKLEVTKDSSFMKFNDEFFDTGLNKGPNFYRNRPNNVPPNDMHFPYHYDFLNSDKSQINLYVNFHEYKDIVIQLDVENFLYDS